MELAQRPRLQVVSGDLPGSSINDHPRGPIITSMPSSTNRSTIMGYPAELSALSFPTLWILADSAQTEPHIFPPSRNVSTSRATEFFGWCIPKVRRDPRRVFGWNRGWAHACEWISVEGGSESVLSSWLRRRCELRVVFSWSARCFPSAMIERLAMPWSFRVRCTADETIRGARLGTLYAQFWARRLESMDAIELWKLCQLCRQTSSEMLKAQRNKCSPRF